ncbi:50S ribosomal protein [Actinidia chinensis var. chinensis]|uniref:50S ribosomal protein n=1 Tax=Actinidia chinensis var. chinensis TaxID=1590841 RepID=A0A2R6Q3I1_ACTCC|nr:50S ribosomal protein [Actinidia chinensis var. chinensis]
MTFLFLRRCTIFPPLVNFHSLSRILSFSSRASKFLNRENGTTPSSSVNNKEIASGNDSIGLHLSPLFSHGKADLDGFRIDLVDAEAWRVSSGLAEAWRGTDRTLERKGFVTEAVDDEEINFSPSINDPDFDDIEDMRIRGNLFYKLDRDSKEFEEYNFDFHRRKSWKKNLDREENEKKKSPNGKSEFGVEKSSINTEERKEIKKRENPGYNSVSGGILMPKLFNNEAFTSSVHEMDISCVGKRVRTPTFNQLTAPYHEPFCLDIYVSKGSVRACIIHRATSHVVAVAHSISKDMKFDLASTKNAAACAAVGEVLAQRALADDIHNVVYTPRKGERLEGKLQIVLQSIIDHGVHVKVKIKQWKVKKAGHSPMT